MTKPSSACRKPTTNDPSPLTMRYKLINHQKQHSFEMNLQLSEAKKWDKLVKVKKMPEQNHVREMGKIPENTYLLWHIVRNAKTKYSKPKLGKLGHCV